MRSLSPIPLLTEAQADQAQRTRENRQQNRQARDKRKLNADGFVQTRQARDRRKEYADGFVHAAASGEIEQASAQHMHAERQTESHPMPFRSNPSESLTWKMTTVLPLLHGSVVVRVAGAGCAGTRIQNQA
jgi:hypothetical protein